MNDVVHSAFCGPYELVAQRPNSLSERADGTLEVYAEHRYLVRLAPGARHGELRGAMSIPEGGAEGILHFGNFIGAAVLAGRAINVRSTRIDASAVEAMFESVAEQLASLPFTIDTPVFSPYARLRDMTPEVLYHVFAFIRDAMASRGGHDLPASLERILARPYETLKRAEPRRTPLAKVDVVDPATLDAIQREPELLGRVSPDSPLAEHPLAKRLGGLMPELIRTRPFAHTTDNRENRFVVSALDAIADVARRFEAIAAASGRPSAATNVRDAGDIVDRVHRWRRHAVLERIDGGNEVPLGSTVLRGRAGYRELLRFYLELLARTAMTDPHDMQALLEIRDSALIYEYWCYFEVVDAVSETLCREPAIDRFKETAESISIPYRYRARWGDVEVVYNGTYSRPAIAPPIRGSNSYSVQLRPDISLRDSTGSLHLFDAKLKVDFAAAIDSMDGGPESASGTFRRSDIHKMHAYRDAIGAESAWILYPGTDSAPAQFSVPWAEEPDSQQGVGAVSLRPGASHDGGLRDLVANLVSA